MVSLLLEDRLFEKLSAYVCRTRTSLAKSLSRRWLIHKNYLQNVQEPNVGQKLNIYWEMHSSLLIINRSSDFIFRSITSQTTTVSAKRITSNSKSARPQTFGRRVKNVSNVKLFLYRISGRFIAQSPMCFCIHSVQMEWLEKDWFHIHIAKWAEGTSSNVL